MVSVELEWACLAYLTSASMPGQQTDILWSIDCLRALGMTRNRCLPSLVYMTRSPWRGRWRCILKCGHKVRGSISLQSVQPSLDTHSCSRQVLLILGCFLFNLLEVHNTSLISTNSNAAAIMVAQISSSLSICCADRLAFQVLNMEVHGRPLFRFKIRGLLTSLFPYHQRFSRGLCCWS